MKPFMTGRKKLIILTALIAAAALLLTGCGDKNAAPDETNTPAATEKPAATDSGIILTTLEPVATPAKSPDDNVKYVDLIKNNEHLYFGASSSEAEGTPQELGPALSFDGDPETRWSSIFYDVEGCYICVEFGYPVVVNGAYIDENQTWGTMLGWEAQYYSEEKQDWVTVYEGFTSTKDEYYKFDRNTEETYAFRLYFLEGTGITITINEIGLMGLFAEVPEGTEPRPAKLTLPPEVVIPDNVSKLSGNWTYAASTIESEGLKADYAFDGDDTTRWGSDFGGLYGAWISAEFGEELTISGFSVYEATSWGHVTSYDAQVFSGGEWKTVLSGETFRRGEYVAFPEPAAGTAFRILVNDGDTISETVTIFEIELYN